MQPAVQPRRPHSLRSCVATFPSSDDLLPSYSMTLTKKKLETKSAGRLTTLALTASVVAGSSVSKQVDASQFSEAGLARTAYPSQGQTNQSSSVVVVSVEKTAWEKRDVRRFKQLAVKRALGTVTEEEQEEFFMLQEARRRLESPLTSDQILAELRRERLMKDLEDFLGKHAPFFQRPHQAK